MAKTNRRFEARAAAPIFAALGDETRLRLVSRLCADGPQSITRLSAGAQVTRQAIAKHLRTLEEAGLVKATRQGRESVWQLQAVRLAVAKSCLKVISRRWDEALGRLQAHLEK